MAKTNDASSKRKIQVRYETTGAVYVSQFILNSNAEDILVNCSSGYISDPNTNDHLLPIQLRMVMTRGAARRLRDSLTQALEQGNGSA